MHSVLGADAGKVRVAQRRLGGDALRGLVRERLDEEVKAIGAQAGHLGGHVDGVPAGERLLRKGKAGTRQL